MPSAATLSSLSFQGMTGPLTLAVRAKLWNELSALSWVGRVFGLQPYLCIAAIAILSLVLLPKSLGLGQENTCGQNIMKP